MSANSASSLVALLFAFVMGNLSGNYRGDQLTLQHCASRGKAVMAGGGSINCTLIKQHAVVKDSK